MSNGLWDRPINPQGIPSFIPSEQEYLFSGAAKGYSAGEIGGGVQASAPAPTTTYVAPQQYQYGGWYTNPATGTVMRWFNGTWTTGAEPGQVAGATTTYQAPSAPSLPSPEEIERQRQEMLKQLSAEYQPLFSELDRQLAETITAKTRGEEIVGGEFEVRKEAVGVSEAKTEREIAGAETKTMETAKQTLRELTEKGGDWLKSVSQLYAGSSGAIAAATGMGKKLTQQRGQILRQRNDAIADFSRKRIDLVEFVNLQYSQIDQWKYAELADIQKEFEAEQTRIKSLKAEAQVNLSQQSFNWASERLANLDKAVSDYEYKLALYQETRAIDLQNALILSEQGFYQDLEKIRVGAQYKVTEPTGGYTIQRIGTDPKTGYAVYGKVNKYTGEITPLWTAGGEIAEEEEKGGEIPWWEEEYPVK